MNILSLETISRLYFLLILNSQNMNMTTVRSNEMISLFFVHIEYKIKTHLTAGSLYLAFGYNEPLDQGKWHFGIETLVSST